MAGDVVDMAGGRETDRLRLALRKAEERIEDLEYDLAEARGEHAREKIVSVNQVWFVPLSPTQAAIINELCAISPRTLTSQGLIERLYESGKEPVGNVMGVLICRLRALLEPIRIEVVTDRGRGWRVTLETAKRWRGWCEAHARGEPAPADFVIDPDRMRSRTGHSARQQKFLDDVAAAGKLLKAGKWIDDVARRLNCKPAMIRAIASALPPQDIDPPALPGRSRDEVIDEAVRLTLAESPVTLPDTARRAAGHAVDLMSEEVMAMIAGGEGE